MLQAWCCRRTAQKAYPEDRDCFKHEPPDDTYDVASSNTYVQGVSTNFTFTPGIIQSLMLQHV